MTALIGKWICCPELMTGFEEFQTAQGATPEEKELWRNHVFTLEISRNGDNWKQVMDIPRAGGSCQQVTGVELPGAKVVHAFKSGELFKFKSLNGKRNMRSNITVQGGKFIERMGIEKDGGSYTEWDKVTEMDGKMLKMTHTCKGAVQVMKLKKI